MAADVAAYNRQVLSELEGRMSVASEEVFATVRDTLQRSAEKATQNINQTLESCDDAISSLQAVNLGKSTCSVSIGFHTNCQVICHLLHLATQLAMFQKPIPTYTQTSQTKQINSRGIADINSRGIADRAMSPKRETPSDCVGVRIGGGYHILGLADKTVRSPPSTPAANNSSKSGNGEASPPATPLSRNSSRDQLSACSPHSKNIDHKYAFGAPSEASQPERYNVGAYVQGTHCVEEIVHDENTKCMRVGESVHADKEGNRPLHLYRYLKSSPYEQDFAAPIPETQSPFPRNGAARSPSPSRSAAATRVGSPPRTRRVRSPKAGPGSPVLPLRQRTSRTATGTEVGTPTGSSSSADALEKPGEYILTGKTLVSSGLSSDEADVGVLPKGAHVNVIDVIDMPEKQRVRGRIEEPAGYISLRNTMIGFRWAEPVPAVPPKAA